MLNKLRIIFYLPFLIFPLLSYLLVFNNIKIKKDVNAWKKQFKIDESFFYALINFLVNFKDFRNLYYYRLKYAAKDKNKFIVLRVLITIFLLLSELFLKKIDTLLISGEIGGGLVLVHAFYSIISPEKMGENCKIWHEVTIGYRNYKAPIIGDNVFISPGAKIVGEIVIESNSKIGPNALVLDNIPKNSIVVSEKSKLLNIVSEEIKK